MVVRIMGVRVGISLPVVRTPGVAIVTVAVAPNDGQVTVRDPVLSWIRSILVT